MKANRRRFISASSTGGLASLPLSAPSRACYGLDSSDAALPARLPRK